MLLRYLSLASSFLLVLLMGLEGLRRPSAASAAPFHAAAAAAIGAIPLNLGTWTGSETPIATAAQTLLKPNAILSRSYINRSAGEQLSLALVQCRDTRDMAGHYPPICYPGQGWAEGAKAVPVDITIPGHTIHATRYEFVREGFDAGRTLVIYNFFAVPGDGFLADMTGIRKLASEFTSRPFGAAQVQIAFGRSRSVAEELPAVQEILTPLSDVLSTLTDPKWRTP